MIKRIQYNSPVILTVTLISLLAQILNYLTDGYTNQLLFTVYRGSLKDIFFYIRLFGHAFGHADWQHFFGNYLMILILGPMLEEKYGSKRMIIMILITAFITGLINIAVFNNSLLGASGIVFMLILLSSFANFTKGKIPLTFILIVVIYIGREVSDAIFTEDNISQFAHIIGGICGGVFGFISSTEQNEEKNDCEPMEQIL